MLARWDEPDALIYADPPYAGVYRLAPTKGYDHDDRDLWPRLVDALLEIRCAAVILSGYPCESAERLGWRHVDLTARRTAQSRDGGVLPLAPERVRLSPAVPDPVAALFEATSL